MRHFTTFLGLAAALTLSAAGTRTLVPKANPFQGAPSWAPAVTEKANPAVLSKQEGAQRLTSDKASRATQMQLRRMAAAPFAPAKAPARVAEENTELILEENFDLFTRGSEDEIDTTYDYSGYITDFEGGHCDPDACDIDAAYTQTPGWTGECVFGAGGAVALYYPGLGGIINTPNTLNLYGVIRVSCRVKSVDSYGSSFLFITPCKGSFENISMAGGNTWSKTFKVEEGWVDVVAEIEVPYNGDDTFIQFNGMNYDDGILIDDLKIERVLDKVMSPENIGTTRYTDDGFTIYWDGDPRADSYIVNLWEKVADNSSSSEILDFNNMAYDAEGIVSDFGASEGWNFDLATIGSQVGINPNDNTEAIRVINDEDRYWNEYWMPSITTPSGSLVNEFKAEIVITHPNTVVNENWGYIMEAEWMLMGIDASGEENYMAMGIIENEEGATLNLDLSAVEDYWYGDVSDYTGKYYGLKLYVVPDGDCEVIVDNISFVSAGALVETQIATDMRIADPEITFTGLNMKGEHYFTVQACLGDFVTDVQKSRIHAFGIKAPVALPATNIDERGEFTANWEPVEGATAYYIHNKMRYTAPEDVQDYNVLKDSFDKDHNYTDFTMEDPYSFDYSTLKSMDEFTVVPGWYAYGLLVGNGFVGVVKDVDEIRYICTPDVNFANGGGVATVYVKAHGTYGDCLAVMFEDGQIYYEYFDANGDVEATLRFSNLDYGCFYFYSGRTGDRIFLEDVCISQDLYAGETVELNLGIYLIKDGYASSCNFAGLDVVPGMNFMYSVYSYAYNDLTGEEYLSESSNDILVDFTELSVRDVAVAKAQVSVDGRTIRSTETAQIYDLQGRMIAAGTEAAVAPGIYVVKTPKTACKVIVK